MVEEAKPLDRKTFGVLSKTAKRQIGHTGYTVFYADYKQKKAIFFTGHAHKINF